MIRKSLILTRIISRELRSFRVWLVLDRQSVYLSTVFVQAHGEVSSPRCSQRVIRFQRISAASHNRRWCPLAPDADGRGVGSGVAQRQVRRCVGGRHVWGGVVWMVERLGCCHQIDQTISPCRRNSTRVRLAWPIPTTFDGISCVCNACVRFHKYHILRVFSCILTAPCLHRYLTSFERQDEELSSAFKDECRTLRTIRHRNVLRFYGAGTTTDGRLFAITELMEMGSLRHVLDRDEAMSWQSRHNMALQVHALLSSRCLYVRVV